MCANQKVGASDRRRSFAFLITMIVFAIAGGAGLVQQGQETSVLRAEIAQAQTDMAELDRLRSENQRLREQQISAAELERLRADHAALPRLRAEVEALEKGASTQVLR